MRTRANSERVGENDGAMGAQGHSQAERSVRLGLLLKRCLRYPLRLRIMVRTEVFERWSCKLTRITRLTNFASPKYVRQMGMCVENRVTFLQFRKLQGFSGPEPEQHQSPCCFSMGPWFPVFKMGGYWMSDESAGLIWPGCGRGSLKLQNMKHGVIGSREIFWTLPPIENCRPDGVSTGKCVVGNFGLSGSKQGRCEAKFWGSMPEEDPNPANRGDGNLCGG
jgi:hypothetical protein